MAGNLDSESPLGSPSWRSLHRLGVVVGRAAGWVSHDVGDDSRSCLRGDLELGVGDRLVAAQVRVVGVVFVGQRPLAVVDGGEAAEAVVGVGDFTAVGQGNLAQAACRVPFIVGDFPTYADSDLETVMQNTMLQIYLD